MISVEEELIKEEGLSLRPYKDTLGNLTIGVGHLLKSSCEIITLEYAGKLLSEDIKIVRNDLARNIPFFNELNEARQYVLISMCFNLGIKKLLTFKKMILALENKNYETASLEMKNSKWHKQVKNRAIKLEKIMSVGSMI